MTQREVCNHRMFPTWRLVADAANTGLVPSTVVANRAAVITRTGLG
ncbi:hypothetical protein [Rhodococcus qingshengii]